METRARYLIVGLFTLAVILGGFGFVYWLHNSGGLSERTAYRIRFETAVPGIRPGSAVLFNGVRAGEVTDLRLSATNPREVMATIDVERNTPVRSDTQVGVESQGLMAAPSVTLRGGNPDAAPLRSAPGEPGMLAADPAASQDTMQAAREVLRHIDKVVVENAEPLRGTVANLKTFTDALARNSERIDPLLDALERMTGTGTGANAPPRSLISPRRGCFRSSARSRPDNSSSSIRPPSLRSRRRRSWSHRQPAPARCSRTPSGATASRSSCRRA